MIYNNNEYLSNNNKLRLEKSISNICNREYRYFLNKDNVVGIGCGYKVRNGFRTSELCIQVFVSRKLPKCKILYNNIIPANFKGIKTDVIESGFFTPCSLRDRVRPVVGGYNISSAVYPNYYGTAGCLVTNGVLRFILTTNHAIANDNKLPLGAHILQPSLRYGGSDPNDVIGTLHKFMPLRFIEGERTPVNLSDCALGLLAERNIFSPEIAFIGKLRGVKSPRLNARVQKVGSVSELTNGTITSISAIFVSTNLDGSRCLFREQIFTTQMAQLGDSGAILINSNNYALGMLIGSGNNITAYCRIDTVLDQLDVYLVT